MGEELSRSNGIFLRKICLKAVVDISVLPYRWHLQIGEEGARAAGQKGEGVGRTCQLSHPEKTVNQLELLHFKFILVFQPQLGGGGGSIYSNNHSRE